MSNRIVYPTRSDYDTVVRRLATFTNDPSLKRSILAFQEDGLFPLIYSGGRAVVYKLKIEGVNKAMKLWVQELGELSTRYKYISDYIAKSSKKYLVNTFYLDDELLVNGIRYPLLLMDWVEELNLKDWLSRNASNSNRMTAVLESLYSLSNDMVESNISHGDLQHNNILIDSEGEVILVDYDSFYMPGLDNLSDEIKGLPGYQHPARLQVKLANSRIDCFSLISIYLSLRALKEAPELFRYCEDLDQLLIGSGDIEDPAGSSVLSKIREIPGMAGLVDSFVDICRINDFTKIPTLDEFIVRSSPISSSVRQKSNWRQYNESKPVRGNANFEWNFETVNDSKKFTRSPCSSRSTAELVKDDVQTFSWVFNTTSEQHQVQSQNAGLDPQNQESTAALREAEQAMQDQDLPVKSDQTSSQSVVTTTKRMGLLSKIIKRIFSLQA
jgi:serine/threonine protein kinase